MRGPLDILYAEWVEECYVEMGVAEWVDRLQDRLRVLCDVSMARGSLVNEKRSAQFNKNKSLRELSVDERVLLRVPGLQGALEASWEGPYVVKEKLSRVNYRVCKEGSDALKIVHINNTKKYAVREANVGAVCVVAEEDKEMCGVLEKGCVLSDEKCDGYVERKLQIVLDKLSSCFSDVPGLCSVGECVIRWV